MTPLTPVGHVASTVAIWTMMLTGLRFAVGAFGWARPVLVAAWHLWRCKGPDTRVCRRRFLDAIDQLHVDLNSAITTPWSGTLLFAGSALIGLGYAAGSSGDAMELVSAHPDAWAVFDVVTDCVAAVLAVTGMAFVHAATARRRTASFLVSAVLIVTGLGIGVLTL